MTMLKFGDVWKIMSEYTFEVDEDCINNNLSCILCENIIINAYQSYCGCQYCCKCIENYFKSDEDKYCPGIKEECKDEHLVLEENVTRRPRINTKISKLKVKCPNQSCMCKIELIKMEEHLRVCTKQPLTCPYITIGCEEGGPKDTVLTHLHDDTLAHTKLLMEYIQIIKNEFGVLKEDFALSKLEISSLKEESRIKDIQITEQMELFKEESRNKEMQFIEKINELKTENRNLKEQTEFEISSLKEESIIKQMNMAEIIENQNKEIKILKEELKEMKNEVDLRLSVMTKDKDKREREVKEHRKEITELWNKEIKKEKENNEETNKERKNNEEINKEFENNEEIKKRRESNSIKLFPNIDTDFIWKIDEISKKRQSNGQHHFSQSFYPNDYKLCLSVFFIEDNVYLCSWIKKGDNDDRVQWPLSKYITVGIVDPQTWTVFKSIKQHYNKQIYNKEAFNKTNKKINKYYIYFSDDNIEDVYLSGVYHPFILYSSMMKERPSCTTNDCLLVFCLLSDN